MKKLIVLRGWPSSGKSTLAYSIIESYTYAHTDAIKPHVYANADEYFMVDGVYCFDNAYLHAAHQFCRFRISKAMQAGIELCIVDNTNTTWREIKPYAIMAKTYGYEIELREPETPWKNDLEECVKRNTHNVPREVIDRMMDRYETNESIYEKISQLESVDVIDKDILTIGPEHTLTHLLFFECVKRPVTVFATQMQEPFHVFTVEGMMKGKVGDYLIKGTHGEYYPCDREIFETNYELL